MRAEVRRLRQRIMAAGGTLDDVKHIEHEVDKAVEQAQAQRPKPMPAAPEPQRRRAIQAGDTVRVKSLNATAEVNSISDGEADVQVGRMRMRVKLSDLERVRAAQQEKPEEDRTKVTYADRGPAPSMELDLRGMTAEEGVGRVEDYLERASRAGLPFVRIIHGKGTGALRRAVRDAIKRDRNVKSYETGLEGEGGDGVTVVKLKTE
jgi:DNA mismatch repair protein MutS2